MIISPSGKRRLMVAQALADPTLQKDGIPVDDGIDTKGINPEDVKLLNQEDGISPTKDTLLNDAQRIEQATPEGGEKDPKEELQAQQEETQASQDKSLTGYLFKKLQGFGYPGRRLMEFKDKFVVQKINADGAKDVQIVIPDTYYGKGQQLSDDDFRRLVHEIQSKYNLFFNGAERSGGKLTIDFTSTNVNATSPEEEAPTEDELSKVYGPSEGGGKSKERIGKPTRKSASTLKELINGNKDNLVEALIKLLGDKNA